MALADFFRPKWKHSKTAVRADAVRKLESGETEVLVRVLQSDADTAIRRIAVKKLEDPELLSHIASTDPDESLRRLAADKLTNLLVALALSDDAEARHSALARVNDDRALAMIAQNSAEADVQRIATERIDDERVLVDVLRKLKDPALRSETLQRIEDTALLRVVALEEGKELALAALERVSDRGALEEISRKAKLKAVRNRAKRTLQATSTPQATDNIANDVERQQRAQRIQLCLQAETLAWSTDWHRTARQLDQAKQLWDSLEIDPAPELAQRFYKACQQYALREAQHHDERLSREAEAKRLRVERVREEEAATHATQADVAPQRPEAAQAAAADVEEKQSIAPAEPLAPTRVEDLYDHQWVVDQAEDSPERDRVFELCYAAEGAIAEKDFQLSLSTLRDIDSVFHDLLLKSGVDRDLSARVDDIFLRIEALRGEQKELQAKQAEKNLERLEAALTKLQAATKSADQRTMERALSEAARTYRRPGSLPTGAPLPELRRSYDELRKLVFGRLQEVKEVEEWKRWVNIKPRIDICDRTEALEKEKDDATMMQALRQLQREWKQTGPIPKERYDELHQRFKKACQALDERRKVYQQQMEQVRDDNLSKKSALCERVEGLISSDDWDVVAEAIKGIQEEWKAIGPTPREKSDEVWQRFRAACDQFFERRRKHLEQVDEGRSDNLTAKIELCEKAEALCQSTDWDSAAEEFRQLQRQWHQVGPVPRKEARDLWRRYRTAREQFFKQRRKAVGKQAASAQHERIALCESVEGLLDWGFERDPAQIVKAAGEAFRAWLALEQPERSREQRRGQARTHGRRYDGRFNDALWQLISHYASALSGSEFDPETGENRRKKLCEQVERLSEPFVTKVQTTEGGVGAGGDVNAAASPEAMAEQLRSALADNALGTNVDPEPDWRAAFKELGELRTAWRKLPPIAPERVGPLQKRFDTAADTIAQARPQTERRERGKGRSRPKS